jgi:hypothetical protein
MRERWVRDERCGDVWCVVCVAREGCGCEESLLISENHLELQGIDV